MTVYLRETSETYFYDFWLDGRRYTGNTLTGDEESARLFEDSVREEARGISITSRAVLRKARRLSGASQRSTARGRVYMIRSGYFIKIGHSNDPIERLKSISTASPDDCELLFSIPGDIAMERALHREFKSSHYRREWFFLCGKLKEFVTELQSPSHGVPKKSRESEPAE